MCKFCVRSVLCVLLLIVSFYVLCVCKCILYCTVLYCTLLYCTLLYCTVLYYTVLYCTLLYYTLPYCTALYCIVLCCTVLYCTILYCTVLYCIVLYCTVLYWTVMLPPGDNPTAVNKYIYTHISCIICRQYGLASILEQFETTLTNCCQLWHAKSTPNMIQICLADRHMRMETKTDVETFCITIWFVSLVEGKKTLFLPWLRFFRAFPQL